MQQHFTQFQLGDNDDDDHQQQQQMSGQKSFDSSPQTQKSFRQSPPQQEELTAKKTRKDSHHLLNVESTPQDEVSRLIYESYQNPHQTTLKEQSVDSSSMSSVVYKDEKVYD